MPEAKGIRVALAVHATDTVAQTGAAFQNIGRELGNAITNEFALEPGNYLVDIVVTMKKVENIQL